MTNRIDGVAPQPQNRARVVRDAEHDADDRRFDGARTVCMINPDNVPSVRVAEKAGYAEYARTSFKGTPTILFERLPARNGAAK